MSENLKQQYYRAVEGKVLSAGVLSTYFSARDDAQEKSFDIIFVGRLDENKGAERLISIIKTLPDLRFLVVGDGEYSEALLQNDFSNLTLVPKATPRQLKAFYGQSKFLLNLSYNESFGLVITEAMACGVPAIVTETDGGRMQIENGLNGYIVPNDEDYINKEFKQFLAEKSTINVKSDEYRKLSINAKRSASPYKLSSIIDELVEVYLSAR